MCSPLNCSHLEYSLIASEYDTLMVSPTTHLDTEMVIFIVAAL